MKHKARCTGCTTEFKAEKRRLFGKAILQHEIRTGHRVDTKQEV